MESRVFFIDICFKFGSLYSNHISTLRSVKLKTIMGGENVIEYSTINIILLSLFVFRKSHTLYVFICKIMKTYNFIIILE